MYLNYPPHDLANLMIRCLLIIYEVVGKFFHQNFDKSSIFELVNKKGKMTQKKWRKRVVVSLWSKIPQSFVNLEKNVSECTDE